MWEEEVDYEMTPLAHTTIDVAPWPSNFSNTMLLIAHLDENYDDSTTPKKKKARLYHKPVFVTSVFVA